MSRVTIEISGKPAGELVAEVFLGSFAGRIAPAYVVENEARAAKALLDVEEYNPELFATTYAGPPITAAISTALSEGSADQEIRVWCAVRAGLPVQGEPVVASYLRFKAGERYIPLAVAVISARSITLSFEAAGAPFNAPPRFDHGGPIDQAWSRAAEVARAWLERAITVLRENARLEVRVSGLRV